MHRGCTECEFGLSKGTVGIQAPTQVIMRTTEERRWGLTHELAIVPPTSNMTNLGQLFGVCINLSSREVGAVFVFGVHGNTIVWLGVNEDVLCVLT